MSRHRELLDCPLCGQMVASFDGLGEPGPGLLVWWRQVLAGHRPACSGPSPVPAPATAAR